MSKTVKNISDKTVAIIGLGIVEAGKLVVVPDEFDNANFEEVLKNKGNMIDENKKEKKVINNK